MVFISTPIQCFFAWRIKKITQSSWIPLLIVTLSIASMGTFSPNQSYLIELTSSCIAGGIWTGIKLIIIKLFARKPELHQPALLWFLTACLADITISVTLIRSIVGNQI